MADSLTSEQRSKNMSAIHSKDTKPELFLRKLLFSLGYRYRICPRYIEGCPDLFLRKYNTAIFVHGCFWHRHNHCKYAYHPKSNTEFWEKKFAQNIRRDHYVQENLKKSGIKCLVVWECTIKQMKKSDEFRSVALRRILEFLQDKSSDGIFREL